MGTGQGEGEGDNGPQVHATSHPPTLSSSPLLDKLRQNILMVCHGDDDDGDDGDDGNSDTSPLLDKLRHFDHQHDNSDCEHGWPL